MNSPRSPSTSRSIAATALSSSPPLTATNAVTAPDGARVTNSSRSRSGTFAFSRNDRFASFAEKR